MRLPLCAAALLVSAAFAGPPQTVARTVGNILNQAKEAREAGDATRAESLYREAVALGERDAAGSPRLAQAYNNLATFLFERAAWDEAERHYRAAAKLWEDSGETATTDYASCLNNLGALERARAEFGPAELHYRKALSIRLALSAVAKRDLATTRANLGELYHALGRFEEAETYLSEAVAAYGTTDAGPRASALNNLGVLYRSTGRGKEAEKAYREVLAVRLDLLGRTHALTANAMSNLAEVLAAKGDVPEASKLFDEAVAIKAAALTADHPDIFKTRVNRADLWLENGRDAEARAELESMIGPMEKAFGAKHPILGYATNGLARALMIEGRSAEAGRLFTRAAELFEAALGAKHPSLAGVLVNDAERLMREGNLALAEKHLTRARAIFVEAFGPDHGEVAQIEYMFGNLLQLASRNREAGVAFERAVAIWEKAPPRDAGGYALALARLSAYRESNEGGKLLARAEALNVPSVQADLLEMRSLHSALMEKWGEAEEKLRRAITLREGAAPESRASSVRLLGEVFAMQGRAQSAEQQYRRAIDILEKAGAANSAGLALAHKQLAALLYETGRTPEARRTLAKAAAIWEARGDQAALGMALGNIGAMQYGEGRHREALTSLERSAELIAASRGKDDPELATAFANLAMVEAELGQSRQAETHIQKSLGIAKTAGALKTYANLLRKLRRGQEAARYEAQAEAIEARSLLPRH